MKRKKTCKSVGPFLFTNGMLDRRVIWSELKIAGTKWELLMGLWWWEGLYSSNINSTNNLTHIYNIIYLCHDCHELWWGNDLSITKGEPSRGIYLADLVNHMKHSTKIQFSRNYDM